MPPRFRRNFQCVLLRILVHLLFSATGLSPSPVLLFNRLCFKQFRLKTSPATPHLFAISNKDSVCSVLFSFATTNNISFDFSSSRYCNALLPWVVYPFGLFQRTRSRIQGPMVQRLHASRHSISLLATPFIDAQTESST